ncbi:hypothetical protein LZ31DRAFT_341321 [Colletotrichum somersetense]|nr:hypothetical protein LZ31DRAFT_341321 [Colletotrichum somersetense]
MSSSISYSHTEPGNPLSTLIIMFYPTTHSFLACISHVAQVCICNDTVNVVDQGVTRRVTPWCRTAWSHGLGYVTEWFRIRILAVRVLAMGWFAKGWGKKPLEQSNAKNIACFIGFCNLLRVGSTWPPPPWTRQHEHVTSHTTIGRLWRTFKRNNGLRPPRLLGCGERVQKLAVAWESHSVDIARS